MTDTHEPAPPAETKVKGIRPSALPWLLFAAATLTFAVSIAGGFLWDDHALIENNAFVHSFTHAWHWFSTEFWNTSGAAHKVFGITYYRPLVTSTFALDWWFGHGSPVVFHATNVLLHGLAAVLAFACFRRWLGRDGPAFVAAMLFAIHPTKAESVAWISARADVLLAVGLFLACLGAGRRLRGQRSVGMAIEAVGVCVAYLSKEAAILLPCLVAIEAWSAIGHPALDRQRAWPILRPALLHVVIAAGYLGIRALWLPPTQRVSVQMSPLVHLSVVAESLGRYVHLTVAPYPLSIQQGLLRATADGRVVPHVGYIALGVVAVAAIVGLAVHFRRKNAAVSLGLVLYGVALLPTSNVVLTPMLTLISERFLYVPMVGIALIAGGLWRAYAPGKETRAGAAVVLALLAALGAARAHQFTDETSFWERELVLQPDSPEATNQLGRRLVKHGEHAGAVQVWLAGYRHGMGSFGYTGAPQGFVVDAAHLVASKTPDAERARLEALDEFLRGLLEAGRGLVVLDLPGLRWEAPHLDAANGNYRPRSVVIAWSTRAAIASRLGNDEAATSFVARQLALPSSEPREARTAALVLARAGRFDEAERVLVAGHQPGDPALPSGLAQLADARRAARTAEVAVGPPRTIAQAKTFAVLFAWGRAFALLAPHADQFKDVASIAIPFAEVAWRAGEAGAATEALQRHFPPERVREMTRAWSEAMGWRARDQDAMPGVFTFPGVEVAVPAAP